MRSFYFSLIPLLFFCIAYSNSFAQKPIRFAVLADMHLALNQPDLGTRLLAKTEMMIKLAVRDINNCGTIDFVVVNGDAVNIPTAYDVQKLQELLGDLQAPYYVTIGNHDVPQPPESPELATIVPSVTKTDFVQLFRGHGFSKTGTYWWSDNPAPDLHIVGMDASHVGTWGGYVSDEQLSWLRWDLSQHRDMLTIVFIHHGLIQFWEGIDFDPRYTVENANDVRKLLESFTNVRIVVNSHYHHSGQKTQNGIHYFVTPGLISYPCAYAIFTLTQDSINYEMVQISDDSIISEAREKVTSKEPNLTTEKKRIWDEMLEGLKSISLPLF